MLKLSGSLLLFGIWIAFDCVQGQTCTYVGLCPRPCNSSWFWCREMMTAAPCLKTQECTTTWAEWSGCSRTCGLGQRYRRGKCVGSNCFALRIDSGSCVEEECVISADGQWSEWYPWEATSCSESCCGGKYSQTRRRTCTNPVPMGEGRECVGEPTETELGIQCSMDPCPFDCSNGTFGQCFPDDCGTCSKRFFVCAGDDKPLEFTCPPGLYWNQTMETCMPERMCTEGDV